MQEPNISSRRPRRKQTLRFQNNHGCRKMCWKLTRDLEEEIYESFSRLNKKNKTNFLKEMIKSRNKNSVRDGSRIQRLYYLPFPFYEVDQTNFRIHVCKETFMRILHIPLSTFRREEISYDSLVAEKVITPIQEEVSEDNSSVESEDISENQETDNSVPSIKIKLKKVTNSVNASVQTDISVNPNDPQHSILQMSITEGNQLPNLLCFTLQKIKCNPMLFLGVSNLSWIDGIYKYLNCGEIPIFLVLHKIRLNTTLSELAFHFNMTENAIVQVLHVYTPLIYNISLEILDWQSVISIVYHLPLDLKIKFGNLRSILKLIKVPVSTTSKIKKFFISITPLGLISYVSDIFNDDVDNVSMIRNSDFFEKVPKNCEIIVDNDLSNTTELFEDHGFRVYVNRNLKNVDELISDDDLVQRDIMTVSQTAGTTFIMFMRFSILHYFSLCGLEDDKALHYVATIISALVNKNLQTVT